MNRYEKYLNLKNTFERVLGVGAWEELKESNSISTWRKWTKKLFAAIKLSIDETVKFADQQWRAEVYSTLERGEENLKKTRQIDEVIATIASVFIELSFWQIGFMPDHRGVGRKVKLNRSSWRLDCDRTLIYLQSEKQLHTQTVRRLQKSLGASEASALEYKYRRSKSNLNFHEWLNNESDSLSEHLP